MLCVFNDEVCASVLTEGVVCRDVVLLTEVQGSLGFFVVTGRVFSFAEEICGALPSGRVVHIVPVEGAEVNGVLPVLTKLCGPSASTSDLSVLPVVIRLPV